MKPIKFITNNIYNNVFCKYHDIQQISKTIPTLFEILFDRKIYLIDYNFKKKYKFKTFLIKLLHKKWGYQQEIHRLIVKLNDNKISTIYISPLHFAVDEILSYYYEYNNTVTFIKLPLNNNNEQSKKIAKILNKKLNKLKNNKLLINKNLILCNIGSYQFIKIFIDIFNKQKIFIRYYDMIGNNDINCANEFNPCNFFLKSNIESYSIFDSKKFDINYQPNFINFDIFNKQYDITEFYPKKNSILFVGSINETRYTNLLNIINNFDLHNVSFYFYIPKILDKHKITLLSSCKNANIKIFNKYISYNDYIKLLLQSSVLIDLYRLEETEGYSYRISESLAMQKKLITNRENIKNEVFYNQQNIIIITKRNKPNLEIIKKFLFSDYISEKNYCNFNKKNFLPFSTD